MRCILEIEALSKRATELPKLLKPLLHRGQTLACRTQSSGQFVLLSPYYGPAPVESGLEGHKFATTIPTIRAAYHERWRPTDFRKTAYAMERAYLHLYKRGENGEEYEIVALHCDPNEARSERHFKYKAGPHIHMMTAGDPLHHSHIGLNNSEIEAVLKSVENLTRAMSTAIVMVGDQVLGFYGK